VELMVAMLIFSIFMVTASAGITHLFQTEQQTQSVSTAGSQLQLAFQSLDRQVRYASGVWATQDASGNSYMTWDSTYQGQAQPTCNELEFSPSSGLLQQRSWPAGSQPGTGWNPLATGLTPDPSNPEANPFITPLNTPVPMVHQQVQITLYDQAGSGTTAASDVTSFVITAMNSSGTNPGEDTVCPAS
jgi:type II secretory pathway pseudopilin PulG